jgi:polyhydroxyalkanoate synthesis repressor PhaR
MVIIKRYPNRKLYDTEAKQYITLEGIAELIRAGKEIQVIDHASGEDLTALTLTQIILEQEKKQNGFLSNSFLTGLIRSSGERLSALQRSFRSPQNFWRQIDEEIRLRIQALVHAGEVTEREGRNMLEKLLSQTARLNERQRLDDHIEGYLAERKVPSQEDIQKLYGQLEEISARLEEMAESNQ